MLTDLTMDKILLQSSELEVNGMTTGEYLYMHALTHRGTDRLKT